MTGLAQASYMRPLTAAIKAGDTSPAPANAYAVAFSSTLGGWVYWTGSAWAAAAAGAGSSATGTAGLQTATYTTAALAAGATENGSITLATGYRIVDATVSAAARVRMYCTAAQRTTDASRAIGSDPAYNTGVVLDLNLTSAATFNLAPVAEGYSRESTPTAGIPIAITATGGGAITLTLVWTAI